MALKRTKVDTGLERQILTGMILSDRFLREVLPIFSPDLLEIKYASIIADWCKGHYKKYEQAPGIFIKDIVAAWKRTDPKEEQVDFIEGFLETLSDEYEHAEKFNAEFLIDKTVAHFKARSLKLLSEDITYFLDKNDLDEAEKSLVEYRRVEKVLTPGIDPYNDVNAIKKAFESTLEPLFTVPGALGKLMNEDFTRDSFVMLIGPEKRGKSWWLQFLGMSAHRQGCNVAEFQCGDMSEERRTRRLQISLARKSDKEKYCGEIFLPVPDCENNQKNLCKERTRACDFGVYEDGELLAYDDVQGYVPCTHCATRNPRRYKGASWCVVREKVTPLNWREAYRVSQEYNQRFRPKGYRLSCHSMYSLNTEGMRRQLELWEQQDGFVPDVILVDYKDIMKSEPGGSKDGRDQKNETSMALRRLQQDLHVCLISATQADAASYYQESLTKANFSEDKRIFGHVTSMYSLNQTIAEKRRGIMRIGALVVRDDDYDESHQVHVAGSLAIGCPYLFSW